MIAKNIKNSAKMKRSRNSYEVGFKLRVVEFAEINAHLTVVLACLADGGKLKPIIIFKQKALSKGTIFPSGVIVQAHPKGSMDEQGIQFWMQQCLDQKTWISKRSLLV